MPITNTVSLPFLTCFSPSKFEGKKQGEATSIWAASREAGGENII
jgi:hypothetical protein